MKCYIGEDDNGLYTIARYKKEGLQEVECTIDDLCSFSKIPQCNMQEIQQKINYILYATQFKLDLKKTRLISSFFYVLNLLILLQYKSNKV